MLLQQTHRKTESRRFDGHLGNRTAVLDLNFLYPFFWPYQYRGIHSSDTKWNRTWKEYDLPEGRRSPRRSEKVNSYFNVNIDQERKKLLDSFPSQPIEFVMN